MNIPQVAHLVACKVSGLPGNHNWSRYAPGCQSIVDFKQNNVFKLVKIG